jgi:gamma-glutamylcyclotransferase (GGCT)/AIG2-like uncharacterized protein YtfP
MENNIRKLFVYGSLRSGFRHPAYEYISKYFQLISEAKVKGCLYDMGNYPAAIPCDEDTFILGELYELKPEANFSWAIEQLDDYEGIHPEEGEPVMYGRDVATVFYGNTQTEAWIYWYRGDVQGQPVIASGDVLQFLHQKSKL